MAKARAAELPIPLEDIAALEPDPTTAPRFELKLPLVIRDVDARRRIESAARCLVVEKYDWSAAAADFERALASVRDRDLQTAVA